VTAELSRSHALQSTTLGAIVFRVRVGPIPATSPDRDDSTAQEGLIGRAAADTTVLASPLHHYMCSGLAPCCRLPTLPSTHLVVEGLFTAEKVGILHLKISNHNIPQNIGLRRPLHQCWLAVHTPLGPPSPSTSSAEVQCFCNPPHVLKRPRVPLEDPLLTKFLLNSLSHSTSARLSKRVVPRSTPSRPVGEA
jgi:hypothetical protein